MKILTLDIETAPSLAYVWKLWQENVSLPQLVEAGELLSFAAKWHGQKDIFYNDRRSEHMLSDLYSFFDEADAIVTWNGDRFDIPHVYREFLLAGFDRPAPAVSIDLFKTVRKRFRFTSNKLDHVAQQLGVGSKLGHTGFQLWRDCLAGDERAWRLMEKYNKQDVRITEKVYDRLSDWVSFTTAESHVSNSTSSKCPKCSASLVKRGFAHTAVATFQQYRCQKGHWIRDTKRIAGTDKREVAW